MDLPPTVRSALEPFLRSDGSFPEQIAAADELINTAWRGLLEAERADGLLDLRVAMRIRAVLKGLLASAGGLSDEHKTLVLGAARYFAEVEDGANDLANAWGFDDDRVVADAVVTFVNEHTGSHHPTTATVFDRPRSRRTRRKRSPVRTLPPLADCVRFALADLPPELGSALLAGAERAIAAVEGVDAMITNLAERAERHVERARDRAGADGLADVKTAVRVGAGLKRLLEEHGGPGEFNDQVLPLIIAAGELFVLTRDGADDFGSSFGFDDDQEALRGVAAIIKRLAPI
jgi:hypothetical protein